ncbi:uncharacterized protein JCM10292_006577 [Rhodotorula paludigena]|uniref:uncharacterized protein n=1 Tax=Rhodotorula paludigena TaxID=86838 RepID=UPI003179F62B
MLSAYLPSMRSVAKWLAGTLLVGLTASGTALYLLQSRLIYPANLPPGSRTNVPRPDEFGMTPFDEIDLTAPDGVRIKAFVIPYARDGVKPSDRPTVLLLHANAGNVGHRLPIARVFWRDMKCNVVALSYRGYGHSEGSPSEKGIKLDAQTALDYVLSHPDLEKTPIFLYGQSIGGAVAIHLASCNAQRVRGLIIENTFLSLPKLVPHILPFVRPFVPFLLHQIWRSESAIASLPSDFPVLMLAGKRDELVEPGQMKGLRRACGSSEVTWREFANGTHNDTCIQPDYFRTIAAWIASHTSASSTPSDPPASLSHFTRPAVATSPLPQSPQPASPTASYDSGADASSTTSGDSSFEMVNRSTASLPSLSGGTGIKELVEQEMMSAGSLGLKAEVEEVLMVGRDTVRDAREEL